MTISSWKGKLMKLSPLTFKWRPRPDVADVTSCETLEAAGTQRPAPVWLSFVVFLRAILSPFLSSFAALCLLASDYGNSKW